MIEKTILFFLRHKIVSLIILGLITIVILYLTLMPPSKIGSHPLYSYDKAGHFMMFFGWTFVFGLISFAMRGVRKTGLLAIFLIGSLFGISIEIAQGMLPYGRNASLYDAIADILGCLTAVLFLRYIREVILNN